MNLPDTYAGGTFNLPLKVAKLVRLAGSATPNEVLAIKAKLLQMGYFLDKVGIVWEKDSIPDSVKKYS